MFAICRICLLAIDKTNSISIYAELASKKSILNIMKECASIGLIISSDIHLKEKLKLSGDDDFSGDDLLGEVGDQEIEEKEINVDSKEWLLDENCLTDSLKHTDEANPTKANKESNCTNVKECDVVFKTPCSFKNHNIKHTGIKPYSCEYCGKGFAMKWAVILHTRVHTGDKPLTCDVCQKKFGSPSGLHNHKRIHDEAKRLYCEICNKAFSDPQLLTVHMRSHTGEKPYMCEVCSKTFCGSNNLSRHMITHQENTMSDMR
ncbi:hypothetical protein NQ317_014686 [Molorchus minor]|uniref:C2H2-type domain-containing protein n=1 Tax=Molorchus minor TaxID=1323400 RepID=A0ABQ9JHV4_9CUCU|nr:hypothetical protein NQ317_014686 [Molorchus minor]